MQYVITFENPKDLSQTWCDVIHDAHDHEGALNKQLQKSWVGKEYFGTVAYVRYADNHPGSYKIFRFLISEPEPQPQPKFSIKKISAIENSKR